MLVVRFRCFVAFFGLPILFLSMFENPLEIAMTVQYHDTFPKHMPCLRNLEDTTTLTDAPFHGLALEHVIEAGPLLPPMARAKLSGEHSNLLTGAELISPDPSGTMWETGTPQ